MARVEYNGLRPSIAERVGALLGWGRKDAPFVVSTIQGLPAARWQTTNVKNYFAEGYRQNSAVFACTRALVQGFAEPPLKCYMDETKKKEIPNHPLRKLVKRPNEVMGEDEFWRIYVAYAVTSGNGYGKIVASNGGVPAQIWPYNDMVMWPESGGKKWIARYVYSLDNGLHREEIDPKEVMHYKYAPDPFSPWKGMGALTPVAREVDTDNELTRYLKALLQNDAVPRTVVKTPVGLMLTPQQIATLKGDFRKMFGGDTRGDVAVLTGGSDITRVALNLQELAFDALRGVPEARIASAYGVPAIVAGLNIGLARSTYSNYEEARKAFTEQTLVPLWKAVAGEVQQSLVPLFGNDCYADFDLTMVRALQDNTDKRMLWVVKLYEAGALTLNEIRAEAGKEAMQGGDELKPPPPPPPMLPPVGDGANANDNQIGDGTGMPPQGKGREWKARDDKSRAALEARIERGMAARLEDLYGKAARAVEG